MIDRLAQVTFSWQLLTDIGQYLYSLNFKSKESRFTFQGTVTEFL